MQLMSAMSPEALMLQSIPMAIFGMVTDLANVLSALYHDLVNDGQDGNASDSAGDILRRLV